MDFSLRCRTAPLSFMDIMSRHFFTPLFFFCNWTLHIYERDFNLGLSKKCHFKSSYNWFKIDILRQLRPLTANYYILDEISQKVMYSYLFASGQLILMHWTHFIPEWPKSSIFNIRTAVATKQAILTIKIWPGGGPGGQNLPQNDLNLALEPPRGP